MRTPIIAGNWKMHKTPAEALGFVTGLVPELSTLHQVERVVIPSYVALPGVAKALENSEIAVGAQDVHHEDEGAFTSSVAAPMLVGLADYVVVGHSETRQYLGVTDELVNLKAKAALRHGLKPIIAMGENLEQNEAGDTEAVCQRQIRAAFEGIPESELPNIVVAYEPIWAIGTGKSASPEQANAIIKTAIRDTLRNLYGDAAADALRIQYGGSVKPNNMRAFMEQPDIDGALVGGASLKIDDFTELVSLAIEAKGLA
ncbi:MAG: triose-phosphate isomerase [Anaerolineales bacterium]